MLRATYLLLHSAVGLASFIPDSTGRLKLIFFFLLRSEERERKREMTYKLLDRRRKETTHFSALSRPQSLACSLEPLNAASVFFFSPGHSSVIASHHSALCGFVCWAVLPRLSQDKKENDQV